MKKAISFILVLAMVFSLATMLPAYADSMDELGDTPAERVPELAQITEEEIDAMDRETANEWFSKAFPTVDPWVLDEISIKNSLKSLAFFEDYWQNRGEKLVSSLRSSNATSTKGTSYYYYGDVGVCWVRDFSQGKSPLTLSETISLTYIVEYSYITWESLDLMYKLQDQDILNQVLAAMVSGGVAYAAEVLLKALGLVGAQVTIPLAVLGVVLTLLPKLDFNAKAVKSIYDSMDHEDDYMFVEFSYSANVPIRVRGCITRQNPIPNPQPGLYGTWIPDEYHYV